MISTGSKRPRRLLRNPFGPQHSGEHANGSPGANLAGRISQARPQFSRSRRPLTKPSVDRRYFFSADACPLAPEMGVEWMSAKCQKRTFSKFIR